MISKTPLTPIMMRTTKTIKNDKLNSHWLVDISLNISNTNIYLNLRGKIETKIFIDLFYDLQKAFDTDYIISLGVQSTQSKMLNPILTFVI